MCLNPGGRRSEKAGSEEMNGCVIMQMLVAHVNAWHAYRRVKESVQAGKLQVGLTLMTRARIKAK